MIGSCGLGVKDGVLHARAAIDSNRLHALVAACGVPEAAGGDLALPRGPHRSKLMVSVLPLRSEAPAFGLASRPVAIVFVADPEVRPHSTVAARIQRRFGLTRKETAFALEIVKGDGIQACADRLGITCATARTHLLHIFQETGARRQAELVRLLMQA